jgi:hypothetical protein
MMETFTLKYRNQEWLYSVYRSDTGQHILVAIVPGVGWSEIARVLDEREVAILDSDKHGFTELATSFLHNRNAAETKQRRIERRIKTIDQNTISLADSAED